MSRPNILLIILDAVRKDHLSCYGHDRETTPNLDLLASEGTRYEQAIAAAPWTPPSHASMFTGQYPSTHGVVGGSPNLTIDDPTVVEALSAADYATFGYSNSHHTSIKKDFDRGFDHYHDLLALPRFRGTMYELSWPYAKYAARWFLRDADDSYFQLQKLRTRIREVQSPFFGFINLNSAHTTYDPPDRFDQFVDDFERWGEVDAEKVDALAYSAGYEYMMDNIWVSDAEWELLRRRYDGEIAYLDHLLGSFFDFLKTEDCFDDTLIIVAADHGEHFGEHGLAYHQFSLFEELINVPMIVKWPENRSPATDKSLTSLVDLAPTMLDAAGVDVPAQMEGQRLRADPPHEAVFAEYAGPYPPLRNRLREYDGFEKHDRGLQAIRTERHKLVVGTDGERALYDVTNEERRIEDEQLMETLAYELEEALGTIQTGQNIGELNDVVEDHLEQMGYL